MRWRFALEGAGAGVWDYDADPGARVFYSPGWKRMLGYAEAEISASLGEVDAAHPPEDH